MKMLMFILIIINPTKNQIAYGQTDKCKMIVKSEELHVKWCDDEDDNVWNININQVTDHTIKDLYHSL